MSSAAALSRRVSVDSLAEYPERIDVRSPAEFANDLEMKSYLDKVGGGLASSSNPYAAAIGTIMSIIASGMGNASAKLDALRIRLGTRLSLAGTGQLFL